MQEKIWQTNYQGIEIVVKNAWNFSGDTYEEICIDNKIVHQERYNIHDDFKLGMSHDYFVRGYKITIKIGSAWYLFGVACQILVNDIHYSGNKIVLFASKKK